MLPQQPSDKEYQYSYNGGSMPEIEKEWLEKADKIYDGCGYYKRRDIKFIAQDLQSAAREAREKAIEDIAKYMMDIDNRFLCPSKRKELGDAIRALKSKG